MFDEHVCNKCGISALGSDGICGSCGWDKYLSEYSEIKLEDNEDSVEDSVEDLIEKEWEDE